MGGTCYHIWMSNGFFSSENLKAIEIFGFIRRIEKQIYKTFQQIRMLLFWVKHIYCGTKNKRQFKVPLKENFLN